MKSLKQIVEGIVTTSDFKLDKRGRKYKAHRTSMNMDQQENTNPYMVEGSSYLDLTPATEKTKRPVQTNLPSARDIIKADRKEIESQFTNNPTDSPYNKDSRAKDKGSKVVNSLADFESVELSGNQIDEVSKKTVSGYNKKAMAYIKNYKYSNNPPSVRRKLENRFSGVERADERLKGSKPTSEEVEMTEGMKSPGQKQDFHMKEEQELDEARGRPAGAATLAKRAAAAAKPRDDEDDDDHYDKDSGVEADQHIHVQLKKAADSDQKPFEVSFKNGKKHTVSQKVAKDVLSATERLKPEHRKNVHDEIHQSYDNLMSVHRLVARN